MTDTPDKRRRALGRRVLPDPDGTIDEDDRAHLAGHYTRGGDDDDDPTPPDQTGGPTVFPRVSLRSIDYATLVYTFRPRGPNVDQPSYEFSNGRRFTQIGDLEI